MLVTVVGTNPIEKFAGNVRHHETYILVGLVGKVSASRAADLGSSPAFPVGLFPRGSLSRSSHTSGRNTGTPVTTLPGAWNYRVSAGTGWPVVSIL